MGNFAEVKEQWRKDIEKSLKDNVAAVTNVIAQRFNVRSPIKTGRFRSSWQIQEGSINPTISPAPDKVGHIGKKKGVIRTVIPEYDTSVKQIAGVEKAFTKVYVTNSLPYAEKIEGGSSTQAPNGIVAITMTEMDILGRR